MKILHLVNEFSAGVARVISAILDAEHDHQTTSLLVYSDTDCPEVLQRYSSRRIVMRREINFRADCRAYKQIQKIIAAFQPDVIHCHSSKAGVLGRLAAKKSSIPVCYSPHGYAFLRTDVSVIKRQFYYVIEKLVARVTQATTIAAGNSELQLARKISHAILIANSVSVPMEPAVNFSDKKILITIGRLTAQKGVDRYLEIVQQLPTDIHCIWIGDGEQRYKLNHCANVTVTGWLPHAEVLQHLTQATMVLQPALWEGLPIAVLEAASLAKPLICSNISGHRDIITSGQNGILFDTPQEALLAIRKLFADEFLRQQVGHAIYQQVNTNFNSKINIPQYYRCYQELINRG